MNVFVVVAVFFGATSVLAETITFEADGTSFNIEFVEIGSPGNPPDVDQRYPGDEKSLGVVDYVYSISKFETSCEGINIFRDLGAVCRGRDTYPFGTSLATIIEYVNWLNEIQGHPHAYDDPTFDETGNMIPDLARNPQARFFITSADEWHKAAYYDPADERYYDYSTGSDARPVSVAEGSEPGTAVLQAFTGIAPAELAGGPSPFGTVGQTGNIHEIEESFRWFRWGINSFGSAQAHLARVSAEELTGGVGFRIVAIPPVPEPSSNFLATLGCLATLIMLRHSPRTPVRS